MSLEKIIETNSTELIKELCEKKPQVVMAAAFELFRKIDNKQNPELTLNYLFTQNPAAEIPQVSIVLPIYNEEENISELYRRLIETLEKLGKFEIIFVNDGSCDRSAEMILNLRSKDSRVKLLNFSRNFGHQAAISAGIDYSRGDAVILMDADLQDPPEILPEILSEWKAGAEVVYAVRKRRKESVFKKSAYFSFYRILQFVSNIDIPLDSGDFCLLDRKVVEQIKSLPERNRFVRGLRSWVGFKQIPFQYERDARFAGEVKYTFRKLLNLAVNGIVSFSSFPLHIATYLGFLTCLAGVIYILFVIAHFFITRESPQGWTSLVVLMLLVGGVQLTLLGVIGEYISRMYDEVKQRPNYIVSKFYK